MVKTAKKSHFLNEQERNCFDILSHAIDHSMHILPKVQVEDLFEKGQDRSDKDFWSKYDKVSQHHLDFLICNRKDFRPLLAIRIRGESHHESISEEDSEFLKTILSHAQVPLLDISFAEIDQYKRDFEEEVMHVRIKDVLGIE